MAKIHVTRTDNRYHIVDDDKFNISKKSIIVHFIFLCIWTGICWNMLTLDNGRLLAVIPTVVHLLISVAIYALQRIRCIPKKNRVSSIKLIVQSIVFSLYYYILIFLITGLATID